MTNLTQLAPAQLQAEHDRLTLELASLDSQIDAKCAKLAAAGAPTLTTGEALTVSWLMEERSTLYTSLYWVDRDLAEGRAL